MGGRDGTHCALDLHYVGVLEKHGVELIGAKRPKPSEIGRGREAVPVEAMDRIGLRIPAPPSYASPEIRARNG